MRERLYNHRPDLITGGCLDTPPGGRGLRLVGGGERQNGKIEYLKGPPLIPIIAHPSSRNQ